jgi:hypothetical protein
MAHPADAMNNLLEFCGFADPAERQAIQLDGFDELDELANLEMKDIDKMSEGFSARTVANGKIVFGMRRTMRLKHAAHWTQDYVRVSRDSAAEGLIDLIDAPTFLDALDVARDRAKMRKHKAEESEALSKAADPGSLKKHKDWANWQRAFNNYLSTIPGQTGIPLNYVIRTEDAPNYDDEGDDDFEQLCIDAAPLDGIVFQADSRKVHQLITGFVSGEAAETWVKRVAKQKNGRLDFKALAEHYGGAGNKQVRIKEAETLRKTLVYRNERAMSFERFLTSMNVMFVAYAENGEEQTETQRFVFSLRRYQTRAWRQPRRLSKSP